MIATIKASSLSASGICSGLFTFAKSTLTPFCNIGVITMKMISNTSITSTMGVTLMSELTLAPSFLLLSDISLISCVLASVPPSHLIGSRPQGGQDSSPKQCSGDGQQLMVENQSRSK